MAWGQSGMARGDSSDAGRGGQGHPVLSPGHQTGEIRHQALGVTDFLCLILSYQDYQTPV